MARAVRERLGGRSAARRRAARGRRGVRCTGNRYTLSTHLSRRSRYDTHYRPRVATSPEHGGVTRHSDGDLVPRDRRHDLVEHPSLAERSTRRQRDQALVHTHHRLGDRAGVRTFPVDVLRRRGRGQRAAPSQSRRGELRFGGRRAAEGRHAEADGPGHQGRRRDGLRGLPPGVRACRRGRTRRQAAARRLHGWQDHAHQSRHDWHGRLRAAAHEGSGIDHRDGGDSRCGGSSARDDNEHLRPPDHSGRRIGTVPPAGRRLPTGRARVLPRDRRGDGYRRGSHARRGGGSRRSSGSRGAGRHALPRSGGDVARQGTPHARLPRRAPQPARHGTHR